MNKPRICGVILSNDLGLIQEAEPVVDIFEIRIDLIGKSWPSVAKIIRKPWIATCRLDSQGGAWSQGESKRKQVFLEACDIGAAMVDIELSTPGLGALVSVLKPKVQLIISHHDFRNTPPSKDLQRLVASQYAAGADIAKISTYANDTSDNIRLLKLLNYSDNEGLIITAMGEKGAIARILGPLSGSAFAFASLQRGLESAKGQLTAHELKQIYSSLNYDYE